MSNPVMEAILSRSSIRGYLDKPLTEEQLTGLKQAALASPTAMNRQEQRFLFITNKEVIAKIDEAIVASFMASGNTAIAERIRSRGGSSLYDPALFIGVFAKEGRFSGVNAGIAAENIAVAAKGLGLDSVILAMPDAAFSGERGKAFAAELGVPEGYAFEIGLSVGYRAVEKEPHAWDESHVIEVK